MSIGDHLSTQVELDRLRARVAELEADGPGTPMGRMNALAEYAENNCGHSPTSAEPFEASIQRRVAELEAENAQHLEEISRLQADIISKRGWEVTPGGMRDARVAELERALGQIKRMKLFPDDKVNRFTLAAAINIAADTLAVHAVLNAPANAREEVMPNRREQISQASSADIATPRPAQSPAGADACPCCGAVGPHCCNHTMETEIGR